ncbi:MAG: DinB family protein [bacterium]
MKTKPRKPRPKYRVPRPKSKPAAKKAKKSASPPNLHGLLLTMIDGAYAEGIWQSSLSGAVENLTPEEALWRPSADRHNIWELVSHIALWKEYAIARLNNKLTKPDTKPYNERDWKRVDLADEAAWKSALARLQSMHNQLRAMVGKMTDSDLMAPLPGLKKPVPYLRLIEGAFTHDVYHCGQIRALAVAQGLK